MLSIGAMNTWSGRYYMELASEDYYLDGGEPPGRWLGSGAEALGLTGLVEKRAFYFVMDGIAPDGSKRLVQDSAGKQHHPGWDLTFSAPKTVSVLWAVADPDLRQKLQDLHHAAVQQAISYLEGCAARTRRGRGGRVREPASLVVASFEHGTSRAQDPQLHTHALVLNVVVRQDGGYGALDGRNLYRHKMAAGAVYRAAFAAGLIRDLLLEVVRRGSMFELASVPRALVHVFSKRRQAIDAVLEERGASGPRASAIAALDTREVKQHVAREVLFRNWREVGRAYGLTASQANALVGRHKPAPLPEVLARQAGDAAWERLERGRVRFTEHELTRAVAEEGAALGATMPAILKWVQDRVQDPAHAQEVARAQGDTVYASTTTLRMEEALAERLSGLAEEKRLDKDHAAGVVATAAVGLWQFTMTEEQRQAFREVARGHAGLAALDVVSGADRFPVLKAARQAWEMAGFTVLGVSPTPRGAQEMEQKTGIHTVTAATLVHDIGPTPSAYLEYHKKQLSRFVAGKRTYTPDEHFVNMTSKTIVVIDRSHQLGLIELDQITREIERTGAKALFAGDTRAQSPHGRGGLFGLIFQHAVRHALASIERQRQGWAQQAVATAGQGERMTALKDYADRDLISIAKSRQEAVNRLFDAWCHGGLRSPRDHRIYAPTADEAAAANARAQALRRAAGQLGQISVTVGDLKIHQWDRVQLLRTERKWGLHAGVTGTVIAVEPLSRNLVVKVDGGGIVGVPLLRYPHVGLAYAEKTADTPGPAPRNAYVLMDDFGRNPDAVYTELSRARDDTLLFTDRRSAGDDLARMVEESRARRESVRNSSERGGRRGPNRPAPGGTPGPARENTAVIPDSDQHHTIGSESRRAILARPAEAKPVSQEPGPGPALVSPRTGPVASAPITPLLGAVPRQAGQAVSVPGAPVSRAVPQQAPPAVLVPAPPGPSVPRPTLTRPALGRPATPNQSQAPFVVPPVPVTRIERPARVKRLVRRVVRRRRRGITMQQSIQYER